MKMSPLLFRKIHKWTGLILGIQFLLWTVSGLGMALIDHEQVAGGPRARDAAPPAIPATGAWSTALGSVEADAITGLTVRPLLDRQVFEVRTAAGVQLFDAATGGRVPVDAELAGRVAEAAYHGEPRVTGVSALDELTLAVREHELPIWRVDFADEQNSTFYVSGSTGALLERRNESWRLWDFLWMLHNMDYVNRTSFNHPLIIIVGFGVFWLAGTGFYLLFKSPWRREFAALRRRRSPSA